MSNAVDIRLSLTGAEAVFRQFKSLQAAASNLGNALGGVGLAAALREAWKAAEESRVAQFQLTAALEAAGEASGDNVRAMIQQAGALQELTGTADETVEAVQRMLLTMGATAEQTYKLTPLVLDVAAAMGTDATTAARQLGAALDGQSVSLGRLNIKATSFDDLLGQINSRFRGQAAALMEARGPMASIQTSLGELTESLGHLLSWSATPFLNELARIGRALQSIAGTDVGGRVSDWLLQSIKTSSGVVPLALGAAGAGALAAALSGPSGTAGITGPRQGGGGFATGVDVEAASITAETERRAAFAKAILKTETSISEQYDFRRKLIAQDESIGESVKERETLAVLREELPVVERMVALRREEFERQLRGDPEKALETTLSAEKTLNETLLRRAEIQSQLRAPPKGSFLAGTQDSFDRFKRVEAFDNAQGLGRGALAGMQETLMQLGTVSQNVANVVSSTLGTAFQTIGNQITQVIVGTQTWGQALANVGRIILTQLINSIVQFFVNLAARALLNALFGQALQSAAAAAASAAWAGPAILASIATYGSAAEIAPAAVASALATAPAIGALGGMAGYATGGLTPGRATLAMVGERGPEMVINAEATRRNLAALQAVNAGADIGTAAAAAGGNRPVNVHVYLDRGEWLRASQDDIEGIAVDAMRRAARA